MSETHTRKKALVKREFLFLFSAFFFLSFLQLFRQRIFLFFCHHSNFPFIFNMREREILTFFVLSFEVIFKINFTFFFAYHCRQHVLIIETTMRWARSHDWKSWFPRYFVVENFQRKKKLLQNVHDLNFFPSDRDVIFQQTEPIFFLNVFATRKMWISRSLSRVHLKNYK